MRKNIKFLSLIVAIVVLMSGVFVIPASAADVNYSVSSAIGATGEIVTVSVKLSSSIELWGANVSLAYNPAELQFVSGDTGNVVGAGGSLNNSGSSVNFSGMYTEKSGTVFTAKFKILLESGKSKLTLSSSENTDADGAVHTCSVSHSTVTVFNTVPAEDVTLDKTSVNLKKGGTHKLVVTVTPENTTDKNILFESSNDKVVTVSSDGVVTAIGGGTATVKVKVGNKTATCNVTVNVPQTGIKANGNTTRTAEIGKSLKLSVVKVPADTSDNFKTTWTSSDTKIATVDSNGTVTPLAEGAVKITAKSNNWTVVYNVTVGAGAVESTTEETTTEESTTIIEESTTEEVTTDIFVTEPITEPAVVIPTEPEEDFSLVEPTTYEDEQESEVDPSSYVYIIILATAGIVTVVAGAVTYFVTKGYYGTKKKQKIVVEERHRGK